MPSIATKHALKDFIKRQAVESLLFAVILRCSRVARTAIFAANELSGALLAIAILVLTSPYWFLARAARSKGEHVFFAGLEHVIKKTAERGEWLETQGYSIRYFSREIRWIDSSKFAGKNLVRTPGFLPLDVLMWTCFMIARRPAYVEVYLFRCSFRTVFYLLTCRCCLVASAVILRGETNPGSKWHTRSWYWKICLHLAIALAGRVYHREIQNAIDVKKLGAKATFDHNCTTVLPLRERQYDDSVLFLNSFKPFRRVDLLARAVRHVTPQVPGVRFSFVGARNEGEADVVRQIIQADGVSDYVEVHSFTDNATQYYENHSVFVLPADPNMTFANYSLLEAMERAMVPVLSNYDDAEHFVEYGVNGLLVEQTPEAIAEAIISLLDDKERLRRMGARSRQVVVSRFNNATRMRHLLEYIKGFYGRR
jgi:glycosyltransferase involved in cell wall biosynthesis